MKKQLALAQEHEPMPKPSPRTKIKPQPNVLFEATVRRMLATPPQPKAAVKKMAKPKKGKK